MSFNTEANGNHKTNRKRKKIYGWDTGCWRASTSHYKFLALWRGHHEQIHMNMKKHTVAMQVNGQTSQKPRKAWMMWSLWRQKEMLQDFWTKFVIPNSFLVLNPLS